MNQTEHLNAIIERRGVEGVYVEYRPLSGWYLVTDEPRYFYDEGDYLGTTAAAAESALLSEIQDAPLNRELASRALREQLTTLALGRVRTQGKSDLIHRNIMRMPYEELCYWSAKCERKGKAGRAAQKAFRVLFEVTE